MNNGTKPRVLPLVFPGFLTVIITVIYSLGVWPRLQLITVNVLCVSLIALELAQAFREEVNAWKVCGFIGSGAIGGILAALNVLNDIRGEVFSLGRLSFWGWLWIGLLAVSVISVVAIIVRMLRWDQVCWEGIRKWRQEYRKERMEARRELRRSKQVYKQELLKAKAVAKLGKQKDQTSKNVIIRNQKHQHLLERFNDWKEDWRNLTALDLKRAKSLVMFAASSLMVVLFLVVPYSTKLQSIIFDWLGAVEWLADNKINSLDNHNEFFRAFANYIIFYILCIVAILMIIFLCRYVYKILTRNGKGENEQNSVEKRNFFQEYDTAIAILTVFTALLFAFGNRGSSFFKLTGVWGTLLEVILFILILFASIEIVRLAVEQIGQKNSLLKRLVRLIFVAILEFLAGLLLGVIINFQIEEVISSLLSLIFPQEELSFASKIQEKFKDVFNRELDDDGNDGDDNLTPPCFSKKYIWRRYHKK